MPRDVPHRLHKVRFFSIGCQRTKNRRSRSYTQGLMNAAVRSRHVSHVTTVYEKSRHIDGSKLLSSMSKHNSAICV